MLGLLLFDFKIGYLLDLFVNKYNLWFDFIPRKQKRACFRFLK